MNREDILDAIQHNQIRITDHADEEAQAITRCPVCGGEMIEKEVEKLLRGGSNTAAVTVRAEVCQHCGERLYSKDTVSRFEQIREKLSRQDVAEFQHLGQSYQAVLH